uniref:Transmembrane protein n=1 Tax=Glossina pallidipes TaxID=7398 RepID=A0A1A9ZRW0_GLOPL
MAEIDILLQLVAITTPRYTKVSKGNRICSRGIKTTNLFVIDVDVAVFAVAVAVAVVADDINDDVQRRHVANRATVAIIGCWPYLYCFVVAVQPLPPLHWSWNYVVVVVVVVVAVDDVAVVAVVVVGPANNNQEFDLNNNLEKNRIKLKK